MARILVFTTDLPYFPGKNGHDFFNLRHLATRHEVVVVSPLYESALPEGVSNLERAIQQVLVWPRPVAPVPLFVHEDAPRFRPSLIRRLPSAFRWWLLRRLLGIQRAPKDAYERLVIQANCAPYLLKALDQGICQAVILIQSNLTHCLEFLPSSSARFIYFHDVRSDYLARARETGGGRLRMDEIRAIGRQEALACNSAEVVGFVSNLDEDRIKRAFQPTAVTGVAPIPVDTFYFAPAPPKWRGPDVPTVLFTGHLTHPPNVDALQYFCSEIWPLIIKEVPSARFVVAGMLPANEIKMLAVSVPNFELHANVPDIRPFFWNARVYVVPMRFGGGVRQKIFEAWSMKIPVVCTTMAAEGIDAGSGFNCWLEDTPSLFASRVIALFNSASSCQLTDNARRQVETTNSIPVAAGCFTALVEKAIAIKKTRPFRLLYDMRWMQIGAAGGTEQMTHELVGAISRLDQRNEYHFFCPRSTYHEWQFPGGFRAHPHYSDLNEKTFESLHAGLVNQLAAGLGAAPVLTRPMRTLGAIRRMNFDLVHSLVSYIHPDLQAYPNILTIHDLQHLTYPQFFSSSQWEERERLYRNSVQRANHIIAISEFTRQEIHRHYGVSLDKITTIWNIPSRNIWIPVREEKRASLLGQMGVGGRFLFYPAQDWAHKNHAKLIEAFALIRPHLPKDITLVLTGRPFSTAHPARSLINELGLNSQIQHLGYRSPREIQVLFQSCFLLVFPSLFEGFGMPVAEAIIAGKPVVCSNCTSLPEIAGDAALTFDPTNIHDIGARLLEAINAPQRYADLAAASRRRRSWFSARLSALKTLAIYQRVYDEIYT